MRKVIWGNIYNNIWCYNQIYYISTIKFFWIKKYIVFVLQIYNEKTVCHEPFNLMKELKWWLSLASFSAPNNGGWLSRVGSTWCLFQLTRFNFEHQTQKVVQNESHTNSCIETLSFDIRGPTPTVVLRH